ncbi:MAG TPA: HEAT repeat domain-containing protein [Acidobacteriota bacterium]|nr:HEAT repeat domain-containing protein [Acidobacteriota bacterium]
MMMNRIFEFGFGMRMVVLGLVLTAAGGVLAAQERRQVPVEGLIYDLQHPDPERKKEAARLLGANKIRDAVPQLVDVSRDPNDGVRLAVMKALVEINDTRALPAYIERLDDRKDDIQQKAIEGLVNMYVYEEGGFVKGVEKAVDFLNPLSDDFNPLMVEPYIPVSQKALQGLAGLLRDQDDDVREDAAEALGILRARSQVGEVQEALTREDDKEVKVELIRAAYKIGDPSVGPALLPLVEDDSKAVRDEAVFALGRLRIHEAVPRLTELLDVKERRRLWKVVPVSGKDDLEKRAFIALAYIGDERSKGTFINGLADPREDFRRYAAEGLARIGQSDQGLIRDIARQRLREDSTQVQLADSFALYRLGRPEHLAALIDEIDRNQAFNYLLELEPGELDQLLPYLESEPKPTQLRLIEVIGLRGNASHLPEMERWSRSEDTDVMAAANMALRRIRGRQGDA